MRIYCTVLRNNGTYKTVPVRAGKSEFELDKNKYFVDRFRIGNIGNIKILRAIYCEGIPSALDFDVNVELKKANLKIDSKAIKNVTNKKILNVFGEEEFTRLEKLVIVLVIGSLACSAIGVVFSFIILSRLGGLS